MVTAFRRICFDLSRKWRFALVLVIATELVGYRCSSVSPRLHWNNG